MAAIIKQYDKRIGVTYAYESTSYWDKDDGKLFVEFIALIYISFLHKAMQDASLYAKFTMHELLNDLETIERFEHEGYAPPTW